MSWNKSYASVDAFSDDKPSFESGASEGKDVLEQVSAARDAAARILTSGAVGTDVDVTVNISGHANPDHEPAAGWANDTITVTVSQK